MITSNRIKIYRWLPRIICILAILFISLFALDAFESHLTLWQQIGAFLVHLIPSFILFGFLLIAWKWEYIGGIVFIIIGVILSPIVFKHNYNMNHTVWISLGVILSTTIPFVIVGILFIGSYFYNKKSNK